VRTHCGLAVDSARTRLGGDVLKTGSCFLFLIIQSLFRNLSSFSNFTVCLEILLTP
jgi:hypothetical protein